MLSRSLQCEYMFSMLFCRWYWRQAGAAHGHKRATGRAVRPRSRQLGDVLHAGGHVQSVRTWRLRRRPGDCLLGAHRRHADVCRVTLGEVQHGRAVSALGLWCQSNGKCIYDIFWDHAKYVPNILPFFVIFWSVNTVLWISLQGMTLAYLITYVYGYTFWKTNFPLTSYQCVDVFALVMHGKWRHSTMS